MKNIVNDIINALNDLKDDKRIAFAKGNYPTKLKVIGVTNPKLKTVLKEIKQITKGLTAQEIIGLSKLLVHTNIIECQQLAYELLDKSKKVLKELTPKDIDDLQGIMDNWVSVDYFSAFIVGYAWREGIIDINKIKNYYHSNDFWIRRIAIVATVSLNQKARGGTGDAKQTLEICKLAIKDHTDMINKALSWALRELAKIDKQSVNDFVITHEKDLHKKVLREVKNKIEFGTKN